jgi:aspartokinase/homoserine dehydrogenase 1
VEPLLDADPWSELELETFWQRLPEVDDAFETRRREAEDDGHRLRYLAALELGEDTTETTAAPILRVAVEAVGPEHPAFGLGGPDNLVAITTDRYLASPLVVRGPGAGPAVTAAGVFSDLLRAAEHR